MLYSKNIVNKKLNSPDILLQTFALSVILWSKVICIGFLHSCLDYQLFHIFISSYSIVCISFLSITHQHTWFISFNSVIEQHVLSSSLMGVRLVGDRLLSLPVIPPPSLQGSSQQSPATPETHSTEAVMTSAVPAAVEEKLPEEPDLSALSLTEKMALFNRLAQKPTSKWLTEGGGTGVAQRRASSRYQTQPITLGEVEKVRSIPVQP